MNAETYEKLLSEYKIPSDLSLEDMSLEDRLAVLEEGYNGRLEMKNETQPNIEKRCNEILESINIAQQRGDMDKVKLLQETMNRLKQFGKLLQENVDELRDLIEYTKELQKSLSSGLVLDRQDEKDRLSELKEAGKVQTVKKLADVMQPASKAPAPQPEPAPAPQPAAQPDPAPAPQPVFANPLLASKLRRAGMELEDENWQKAQQLYNDILDEEPEDAEANLGLFMANRQIRGKKHISEAVRTAWKSKVDLCQDKQFLRAKRFADYAQKKELAVFEKVRDRLIDEDKMEAQMKKGQEEYPKALSAYRVAKRTNVLADWCRARNLFATLGDYLDSREKYEECLRGIDEWRKIYG